MEILLAGFKNRNEMVAIIGNEDMLFKRKDRKSWTASTVRLSKLYTLVFRMTAYLEHSIVGSSVCACALTRDATLLHETKLHATIM